MSTEVATAIISAVTTLLVSIGTWNVTMRQHREKTQQDMNKALDEVKDTMTVSNANIQQHLSIIDLKIETLSNRVEKHNGVIERTYKLEQESAVHTEQIKVANHRIEDLERHETA